MNGLKKTQDALWWLCLSVLSMYIQPIIIYFVFGKFFYQSELIEMAIKEKAFLWALYLSAPYLFIFCSSVSFLFAMGKYIFGKSGADKNND